jgi:putative Ca2+/H+ antiporter (TMEM165/GDT1 family)
VPVASTVVLGAAVVAFGVVFVAELGDKSQLLALTLATRYRALPVLAGLALAAASLMALAVVAGAAVSAALPTEALSVVGGLAFLVFAVLTLRDSSSLASSDVEAEAEAAGLGRRPGVLAVAGAFALAELGDKTMLAALALAATNGVIGTWVGATAGMVAASSLAVLVGSQLGARLPERAVRIGAAAMFAVFGLLLLADGLL